MNTPSPKMECKHLYAFSTKNKGKVRRPIHVTKQILIHIISVCFNQKVLKEVLALFMLYIGLKQLI